MTISNKVQGLSKARGNSKKVSEKETEIDDRQSMCRKRKVTGAAQKEEHQTTKNDEVKY